MNWSDAAVARFALPDLSIPLGPDPSEAAAAEAAELAVRHEAELDEAYRRGYDDGRQAGQGAAEAIVQPAVSAIAEAADALRAVQAALEAEASDALLALAVAVAREIVQRELQQDPEQLRALVKRAVAILPMEQTLEIRLHPDDLAALEGDLEMQAAGGRRLEVTWVADHTLERGGYRVETPSRVVDAGLDLQLDEYYRRLRDV